jgi:hypothetical protein
MGKTWKQFCPIMKGVCVNGFVKGMPESETGERTCCGFFVTLVGKNPQTDEVVNDPGCAVYFLPIINLEGNQMIRHAAASTDKVATEVQRHHATFIGALSEDGRMKLIQADPRMNGKLLEE